MARVIRFPRSPRSASTAPPALVELRRCRDQAEAVVVKSLLESEGVQVVLRSNLAQSVHPFSVGAQAEVTLLVQDVDAQRAHRILRRASSA